MSHSARRPLIVLALVVLAAGVSAFLLVRRHKAYEAVLGEFRERLAASVDEAVDFLAAKARADTSFLVWLKHRLDRKPGETPADHEAAAAHAAVLAAGGEFKVPLRVLFSALRYRYRAGLPLNALSRWEGMRNVFDFVKPASFADARDKEALFWMSFFHLDAMRFYLRTFGFEEFQALLQAVLFYPHSRRVNTPFDSSPCRRAAAALISLPALKALTDGTFSLPFGLDEGVDRAFQPPADLEPALGWKPALEWYLEGMKSRPQARERFLLRMASLDSDEARRIVEEELEREPPEGDFLPLFFEPCYANGVRMPPALIRKGLESRDERVRTEAMMNVLNLAGAERTAMVREVLERDDLHVKYLLVHRLEADDLDDAAWKALKGIFERDLTLDWGISRLEAFEAAACAYRIFGNTGVMDLMPRRLFERHPRKLADVVELLTGKAEIREFRSLAAELERRVGSPVWWLVAGSELGETPAEDLPGRALALFLRSFDAEAEGTPPPWWRSLYAADALDPSPRRVKDPLLPLRMFGFMPVDDPWDILRRAFRRGDGRTVSLALADEDAAKRFFDSFRE